MKITFIEIAEKILNEIKRPLKSEEIVQYALNEKLLETKGLTPSFSMKARISTDIREKGFSSKFMRVGPNRFALREFGLKEHISLPFKKRIPDETVTCLEQRKLSNLTDFFGFSTDAQLLKDLLINDNLSFLKRPSAENNDNYKQIISYVLLVNKNNEILTYKRGAYSNAADMLKGSTCLGFGGHVQEMDTLNIFSKGAAGVYDTAEREVFEELKGLMPTGLETIGFINDNSSPEGVKHFGIVLKGIIPESFNIREIGKELSVNGLRFMSIQNIWDHFYEFEFWSQLVIRGLYSDRINGNPVVIRPPKFNLTSDVLVFVGEIASGKTIICEILSSRLGFNHISTRSCVAKLIEMKDFGIEDRTEFQKKAEKFIKRKNGPRLLATEIKNQINQKTGVSVIDGIRHISTLTELKEFFPDLIVFYVESTRDDAFRNYYIRSKQKANINDFRQARFHPVENEVQQLKFVSDAYIFNGGTEQQLFDAFLNWYNTNKNE